MLKKSICCAEIAFSELVLNLPVQIIVGILGFPIAKREAHREQCAIGVYALAIGAHNFMLRGEDKLMPPPPAFEQILERFAEYAFAPTARYRLQPVQFGAIFVD